MSSHYHRKTPPTKTELLRGVIDMIGKPHKDMKYETHGSLLNDLECSLIQAKKTHKAPMVDEVMMMTAKHLYENIKRVYDAQDFYCVASRRSVAYNKKFAREWNCCKHT